MWDRKSVANIATVAKTFGIPSSTLRYWESMGLVSTERKENNYREYTYASMIDISDICYLRNLGVSVKDIRAYRLLSTKEINAVYLRKKTELEEQIRSLHDTYSMLRKTLSLMDELEHVRSHPYEKGKPEISLLLSHSKLYDREVWKKYFNGQYQFAGVCSGPPDFKWVWGWAAERCSEDEELVWSFSEKDRCFVQFILRIDAGTRKKSNLPEVCDYLNSRGYTTGEIIAKYITVAYEDGERWDYYKAWIEIR